MDSKDKIGDEAEIWINKMLPKLQYKQDFTLCWGHSKPMVDDDGKNIGIQIRRPYFRLFSTGLEKIYRMTVLGEELPDVEYSGEEDTELNKFDEAMEKLHRERDGGGWN